MEPEQCERCFHEIADVLQKHEFEAWPEQQLDKLIEMLRCFTSSSKASRKRERSPCSSETSGDQLRDEDSDDIYRKLSQFRTKLRKAVPYGSVEESTHVPPKSSTFENNVPTFDVDAFLYDEEDVRQLASDGHLSFEYCKRCKSTEIGLTQFISHSFSLEQLVYLFGYLMPLVVVPLLQKETLRCRGFTLCDVGSRLGVVLAAAAAGNDALQRRRRGQHRQEQLFSRIVGIEVNKAWCNVQTESLKACGLHNECVSVVCDDVLSERGAQIIRASDVVVLHNVFEWFHEVSGVEHSWRTLRALITRKGQLIVASPSLEESCLQLPGLGSTFTEAWAQKIDTAHAVRKFELNRLAPDAGSDEDDDHNEHLELVKNIHLYCVTGNGG